VSSTEKTRNLLWNIYDYYRQFLPNVAKFISDTRRKVADAVKVSAVFIV